MARYETDEKIYALATAYYPSALAIIRLSGENSIASLSNIFSHKEKLLNAKSNTILHGYILDEEGRKIDEVVLAIYKKGHGYTAEEAVEITMHGSLPLINALFGALRKEGFREALPGEFTYRAFMHGRLDLTEAEAVEEIISAKSLGGAESALERLGGGLSRVLSEVKEELLDILSSLEVQLDYAEDEILEDWIYPDETIERIISRLSSILGTYNAEKIMSQGAKVVLAGRTNAGKSSFFNALLKEKRAIVSDIEGTTRDYIEADILINGIPCRLFDTAGLREGGEEIEKEGIKRSKTLIEDADLVIYITDGSDKNVPPSSDKILVVHSKSDERKCGFEFEFSSLTGEGIKKILDEISRRLKKNESLDNEVKIESARQRDGIEDCIKILNESKKNKELSVDLMALLFQSAIKSLNMLIGDVTNDDILDRLFSKFCLGK